MKTPVLELVDGIWPNCGTYIQCVIPYECLTDKAFDGAEAGENMASIDLAGLIERHLAEGVCELSIPSPAEAVRTVSALRKYADYLEREFIFTPAQDRS